MKRYFAAWMLLLFLLCACDAQEPSEKPRMPTTNGQTEKAAVMEAVDAEGTYRVTSEEAESGELLFLMQTEEGAAAVYTVQAQGAYILHAEDSRRERLSLTAEEQVMGGYYRDAAYLLLTAPSGQVLWLPSGERISLDGIFADGAEVKWLLGTQDGQLLLCSDGQAAALDGLRQVIWTERFAGEILTALETSDHKILILAQWDDMAVLQEVELATGRLTLRSTVPQALLSCHLAAGDRWGYDLLAWDKTALYGWRAGASHVERLFTWESLRLAEIQAVACLDKETILAVGQGSEETAVHVTISRAPAQADEVPTSWRQCYLTLLQNELEGGLQAVGLLDTTQCGQPNLILWRAGSPDGVIYEASDGAARQITDKVYPGSPPEEAWVLLLAPEGEQLSLSEAADWVRAWPGNGLPSEAVVSLEEAAAYASATAVRKRESRYHLEMEVPAEYAEDLTSDVLEQNIFQFCDGETQAQTGMLGLCWSVLAWEKGDYEEAYGQESESWVEGMLTPNDLMLGRDEARVYLLHLPSDVQYDAATANSYYLHFLKGYAMLTDFFSRNAITPSPYWEAEYRKKLCAMADFGGDFRRVEFGCGQRESNDPALTAWAALAANLCFLDGEEALSWGDVAVYRLMEAYEELEGAEIALCADALPSWSILAYLDPDDVEDQATAALLEFCRQLKEVPLLSEACASALWRITISGDIWTLTYPLGTLEANPSALIAAAQSNQ